MPSDGTKEQQGLNPSESSWQLCSFFKAENTPIRHASNEMDIINITSRVSKVCVARHHIGINRYVMSSLEDTMALERVHPAGRRSQQGLFAHVSFLSSNFYDSESNLFNRETCN